MENGNILIFDNGTHRLDHPIPHSRVIEVDPATKEIVWSYQEHYPFDFYSPLISGAQRLPNGNTLICEGSFGRIFEVTMEREVVWEYVNPYFVAPPLPEGCATGQPCIPGVSVSEGTGRTVVVSRVGAMAAASALSGPHGYQVGRGCGHRPYP